MGEDLGFAPSKPERRQPRWLEASKMQLQKENGFVVFGKHPNRQSLAVPIDNQGMARCRKMQRFPQLVVMKVHPRVVPHAGGSKRRGIATERRHIAHLHAEVHAEHRGRRERDARSQRAGRRCQPAQRRPYWHRQLNGRFLDDRRPPDRIDRSGGSIFFDCQSSLSPHRSIIATQSVRSPYRLTGGTTLPKRLRSLFFRTVSAQCVRQSARFERCKRPGNAG